MKLPTRKIKQQPTYNLNQRAANKLVALYYEMLSQWDDRMEFNQDDCEVCVIGNSLKRGVIRLRGNKSGFDDAVTSIGLPTHIKNPMGAEYSVLQDFLFGGVDDVVGGGRDLQMPINVHGDVDIDYEYDLTPLDAAVRIAAVLERGGYEINYLPNIPQS